jgi:DNA-binding NtrC family response regulator
MPIRVLIVEPDPDLRERMMASAQWLGYADAEADFNFARARLLSKPYDWIVTNLRLDAYNGLHLVHVAAAAKISARVLVYSESRDAALAREAQKFGAFFEVKRGIDRALVTYLRGMAPAVDRRNAEVHDRRRDQRSGRRCSDRGVDSVTAAGYAALARAPLRVH